MSAKIPKKAAPKAKQHVTEEQEDFLVADARPRWYIIQTYVGFEDAVRKVLDQKRETLQLQDKILEVYLPVKKVIKLDSKGRRQEKIERIHPGYLYVHMILDREVGYVLQNTSYVSRITGTGNFAVALDDDYVDKMKAQLLQESQASQASKTITYRLGDLVRVNDGPFKDMQGKVCGTDNVNGKVSVLLSIFDRETSVDLDILEVSKVL